MANRYLYYYFEDSWTEASDAWAHKIWFETKDQILQRSLRHLSARYTKIRKQVAGMNISEEQKTFISDMLNGKMLKGISKMSVAEVADKSEPTRYSPDKEHLREIIQEISNLDATWDQIDKLTTLLNEAIETLNEEAQGLLGEYVSNLIAEINEKNADGTDFAIGELQKYNSTEKKIIASLLGRFNHKAFEIQHRNSDFNTSMVEIKAALESLKRLRIDGFTEDESVVVAHSNSKEIKEVQGDQILKELITKCLGWLRQVDKVTKEVSAGKGMIDTFMQIGDFQEEIKKIVKTSHTGSGSYETNLHFSKELEQLLRDSGNTQVFNKRVSKKDFSIDITPEGVSATISLGANAKNYEKAISEKFKSYHLTIQGGAPLTTILTRDAGYNINDLWAILQVASNIYRDKGDDGYPEIEKRWDNFVQMIAYRSFLSAIAGLDNTEDQSFYMVINGNFWTMRDFMSHFLEKNSSSKVGIREIVPKGATGPHGGLNWRTYQEKNIQLWEADYERDGVLDNARNRSNNLWQESLQIMHDTKTSIELNIREISRLMQLAL